MAQATLAWPSTITVQQPHWPVGEQPSLGEVTPHPSRITSRRVAPGSASTARASPLSTSSMRGIPDDHHAADGGSSYLDAERHAAKLFERRDTIATCANLPQ